MWRSWMNNLLVAALAVPLAGCVVSPVTAAPAASPNIVMIMTDDQTAATLSVMPHVKRLLVDEGTTFRNMFAAFPLCCPSRATYLTGQHAHNHGVLDNHLPYGGYPMLRGDNTLPVWLSESGYHTVHIGKYLNEYGAVRPREVPPGWQEWHGLVAGSAYRMYGNVINHDGRLKRYGRWNKEQPKYYQTDVLRDLALDYIDRRAPRREPFFLSVAPLAPHVEMGAKIVRKYGRNTVRPAPRHKGEFAHRRLPRPPSFNEPDVSDKPRHIRELPPMSARDIREVTARYRQQLASLLAVDEMVAAIVKRLRATGELENTTIMFTSDNGYLSGEHRIRHGKRHPYQSSVRVPLVIRGAGFPKGRTIRQPVSNVDWAATIVDVANVPPGLALDGRSVLALVRNPRSGNGRELLFEGAPLPRPRRYTAIRTARYTYISHSTGEVELYDRKRDPYLLHSRHADPAYRKARAQLAERLGRLRRCVGRGCWGIHPPDDEPPRFGERNGASRAAVVPGARNAGGLADSDPVRTAVSPLERALRTAGVALAGLLLVAGVAAVTGLVVQQVTGRRVAGRRVTGRRVTGRRPTDRD